MTPFDLTPQPLRTDAQRKKRWTLWITLAVITLAINGFWTGYTYWNYHQADQKRQETAQQYDKLQQNIQSLTKDQSQLNQWRDRLIVFDKLGRYLDYVHILNFLSQNCPELITLSNLEFRPNTDKITQATALPKSSTMFEINEEATNASNTSNPMTMTLKGQSANHKAVAETLRVLKNSDLFLNTQLINSKRSTRSSKTTVNFEITCEVSPFQSMDENNYAHTQQIQTF